MTETISLACKFLIHIIMVYLQFASNKAEVSTDNYLAKKKHIYNLYITAHSSFCSFPRASFSSLKSINVYDRMLNVMNLQCVFLLNNTHKATHPVRAPKYVYSH